MNRRRKSSRSLTGTRIYVHRGKFQYFSPDPITNPATGKTSKWHPLCPVSAGEAFARETLNALLGRQEPVDGKGDFPIWFGKWRTQMLQQRDLKAPKDPARLKTWQEGTKSLMSSLKIVETGLADFDVAQVTPVDVATFLDQWEGRRSAQAYRGHLSKFFAWCCRKGLRETNPAREVEVTAPKKRDVYITDEQFKSIKEALLAGRGGMYRRTGEMVVCYMDLLYLLYQRGTDIRLLRWDQVEEERILFKPTKTEHSSGAKVAVPIGEDARAVLARAKNIRKLRSIYVIHTEEGQPYTSHGIGSIFERACKRAGIAGVTLKDIRAKAATDAKNLGYQESQLQTALAHTDGATTRGYIRSRAVPVSEVILRLPK